VQDPLGVVVCPHRRGDALPDAPVKGKQILYNFVPDNNITRLEATLKDPLSVIAAAMSFRTFLSRANDSFDFKFSVQSIKQAPVDSISSS
jgi:hypothetical protein